MTRIVITDDHPIVLDGLKNLLNSQGSFSVINVFPDGSSLLEALKSEQPDVILLDINLPDISGLELISRIKTLSPDTRIITLSVHNEYPVINSMLMQGVDGYVQKNAVGDEIVEAILAVMEGEQYLCAKTKAIISKKETRGLQAVPKVTRREKEILQLAARGLTTQQIADELFISSHTVDSHRKNLMEKFEVKNISSAIKLAAEYGILSY